MQCSVGSGTSAVGSVSSPAGDDGLVSGVELGTFTVGRGLSSAAGSAVKVPGSVSGVSGGSHADAAAVVEREEEGVLQMFK